ncbi:MAG: ABC transporter permease [Treponemataceae bacterium]|nr:MAG: ABC transporter permease [Treponemataceae bacterium]
MKALSSLFAAANWILFVSNRFSRVERNSRSAATGWLSSLGICFGVMTLIVTLSVMNGFQRSYIDSIMEISSSHVRYAAPKGAARDALDAIKKSLTDPAITAVYPFMEAQTLMTGISGMTGRQLDRQQAALIRAVPDNITSLDTGFAREVKIYRGSFNLTESSSIVIGNLLARSLGVTVGDKVNLLALSGGADVDLISANRQFTVTGIFSSGYADINSTFAFISLHDGFTHLGAAPLLFSIKLRNPDRSETIMRRLKEKIDGGTWESWQHYNRAFFGALRIEKNILFLLVFIIFVVVGVNIYNGMRRMVFERRAEIAVFSALGGRKHAIQSVFVLRGLLTGFSGAVPGLVLGLLICVRMDSVFLLAASLQYYAELFFAQLFNPRNALLLRSNSMYSVYASIPARVFPFEALLTTLFGFLSAVFASWAASRSMLALPTAEVLRDE